MSGARQNTWSDNPNAPKIPYDLYFSEKATFAGTLIASALYGTSTHTHLRVRSSVFDLLIPGILVVLFFQCMGALLSPVNRKREGVRWGLVSYTVAMFSCATVVSGGAQYFASISFIDNRNFPGIEGVAPPGPLGYQQTICTTKAGTGPSFASCLGYWLADGLLVGHLFDRAPRCLTPAPLASSLLYNIQPKPLDHHLTLPYVPYHSGWVYKFPQTGEGVLG